jgi:hypothetical protein
VITSAPNRISRKTDQMLTAVACCLLFLLACIFGAAYLAKHYHDGGHGEL